MNELFYDQDEQEQQEQFVVDNDTKAEWCLQKLKELQQENNRLISTCNEQIKYYENKKKILEEKNETKENYFLMQLENYFNTIEENQKKESGTQVKYSLPSASLVKKKDKGKIILEDEEKVLENLTNENALGSEYIKYSFIKKLDWINYKKTLQISGKNIIDENGEIVEGVAIEEIKGKFEIKFEK